MIDLFLNLVGDVSNYSPDLVFSFAAVFFLFLITEFCRFLELTIDFVFRRKK